MGNESTSATPESKALNEILSWQDCKHLKALDDYVGSWRYGQQYGWVVEKNAKERQWLHRTASSRVCLLSQIVQRQPLGEYQWAELLEVVPKDLYNRLVVYDGMKPDHLNNDLIEPEVVPHIVRYNRLLNAYKRTNAQSQHSLAKLQMELSNQYDEMIKEYPENKQLWVIIAKMFDENQGIPVGLTPMSMLEPKPIPLSGEKIILYRGDSRPNPKNFLAGGLTDYKLTLHEIEYIRELMLNYKYKMHRMQIKKFHTNRNKSNPIFDPVCSFTENHKLAQQWGKLGGVWEVEVPVEWTIPISQITQQIVKEYAWGPKYGSSDDDYEIARRYEVGAVSSQVGEVSEVYVVGGFDFDDPLVRVSKYS